MMNSNKIVKLLNFYQDLGIQSVLEKTGLADHIPSSNTTSVKISTNKLVEDKPSIPNPNTQITPTVLKKTPILAPEPINLKQVNSLTELRKALDDFDQCLLKKSAINTVFGNGNEQAKIMLIGEAPGAEEDEQGLPFVGRSGKLLMKALTSINIYREDIFITNTVFWRPPGNRNPTPEEIMLCHPFVIKMIELLNPTIIILVGRTAATNLLQNNDSISSMRGRWHNIPFSDKEPNRQILTRVIFHPAYLLRNPSQKKVLWLDLLEIKDKIKQLHI